MEVVIDESVVFFGSGPVAAASLEFLAKHFTIEALVTKPVTRVEMEQAAPGVRSYHVQTKHELTELIRQRPFRSRIGIIVDFGIIVEQAVIDYFPLGIVNSHFSLLPRWRGADPISFAILEGDQKTGVSLMLIEVELDTGSLIGQKSLKIAPKDTTPTLTKKLIDLSNAMLIEYVPRYASGQIKPHAQPHPSRATYSRKLTKDDGLVDWQKPAAVIEREIRAFAEWPKSRTQLAGKEVIITKASVEAENAKHDLGKAFITDTKKLAVQTGAGLIIIDELKPAGKNNMSSEAFIAGHWQQLK